MARDYEDLHDTDDLSDDELRALVHAQLRDNHGIDVDDIAVRVEDGVVHLAGRVGTEAELRIAEHVVTDVLGLANVSNEMVVDPIRRAQSPDAIDDHLADEEEHEGLLLGDRALPLSPEVEQVRDDVDERLYGTTDVQKAIEGGTAYTPPTSPTPEGLGGTDAGPGAMGEDH
ncbi:MAG TPA: BON domain-containing protein [Gemmatimonadaceae bacterium]|nr:BON domain-containing protein [Gemmatimonadaceae bacterium]